MYRRQPPRRHACTRCVRLKVKCVPLDATSCQRCTRLGHPSCVFPEHVRGSANSNIPRPQPDAQDTSGTAASTPGQNGGFDSIFHDTISLHLTNELLDKYRRHKMPQFPFVVIPHETDVADLRRRSPFLLLCILTASLEHNSELHSTLETLVRKEVARRMIVDIERNMDLLQGLLVHIAWYYYHWRTYHTHMYMLLQMVTMMIGDLGLDREESFHLREIPRGDKDLSQAYRETSPSAAGQRAFLGCYFLCSKLSVFRPQLRMRHTKWMDQCAESLAEKAEYPTDSQLRSYVHVQSLVYQGHLLFDEGRRLPGPSLDLWKQLLDRLEKQRSHSGDVWSSLNADESWSLRIELEATTALVLGQAVKRRRDVFQLEQLDQLEALTVSAHNVIDTFLSVPLSMAVHLSPSSYATVWCCLLVLSKLMLLFHQEQRRDTVLDNKRVHDQAVAVVRKFEKLTVGEDVWASSKRVVGNMLAWVEKTLAARPDSGPSNSHPGRASPSTESPVLGPRQREGVDPQVGWPPTCAPDDLTPGYHFQPGDELWQQMLDSFTWFEPLTEGGLSTGHYNSFN